MTAPSMTMNGGVHTGACAAVRRAVGPLASWLGKRQLPERRERQYCLHDEDGRPVGVIRAPAERPSLGAHAPAVYLERTP
jgi:hypothetical protein